jgi:cell fate regulator YaaT (PSP1 superfamily)
MYGGLGPCGRALCCASFLTDFAPVGIRMAKEQDLSLNPQKISGVCGRLMCCLNYEHEFYRESRRCLPKIGSIVQTEKGPGRIVDINVLRDRVVVNLEEGGQLFLTMEAVAVHRPNCPHRCPKAAPAEPEEDLGPDVIPDEEG